MTTLKNEKIVHYGEPEQAYLIDFNTEIVWKLVYGDLNGTIGVHRVLPAIEVTVLLLLKEGLITKNKEYVYGKQR